MVSINNQRHRH